MAARKIHRRDPAGGEVILDDDGQDDYYYHTRERGARQPPPPPPPPPSYYDDEDDYEGEEDSSLVTWDFEQEPKVKRIKYYKSQEQAEESRKRRRTEYRPPPPPPVPSYDYGEKPGYDQRAYMYNRYPTQSFWDQTGFYNLIWDPRYNVKIPVMQIIAIVSLIIIYILNYSINIDFFNLLGSFSPYVAGQPPEIAWVFALMLALFISIFPRMEREYRITISLGIIIIIILFFIGGPIIAYFSTHDMMAVGQALANSLIGFLKVIAVLLYWAPIIIGVYAIFTRERMYVFLAVLFFIGIIIANDLYLLSENLQNTKTATDIPQFTVFALALFCYYEMSDSSINFYRLNDSTLDRDRYSAHHEHLNRILQRYFVFFIIFSALALVLTLIILDFNSVLKAMGSAQVAASMELNSIYGTIISLVFMVFILIIIGYIVRNEYRIKDFAVSTQKALKRLFTGRGAGDSEDDEKTSTPPKYSPDEPSAFPYADDKVHSIMISEEL